MNENSPLKLALDFMTDSSPEKMKDEDFAFLTAWIIIKSEDMSLPFDVEVVNFLYTNAKSDHHLLSLLTIAEKLSDPKASASMVDIALENVAAFEQIIDDFNPDNPYGKITLEEYEKVLDIVDTLFTKEQQEDLSKITILEECLKYPELNTWNTVASVLIT